MAIIANVSGALKTLNTIHANVNGTLKALNTVYANVSGALKQIYSSKPQTLTGTANCSSQTAFKEIAVNVNIPAACTVTFTATIAETPSYESRGARAFQAVNSAGAATNFSVISNGFTDMTATAVLPAGVYTFKVLVFNVHGDRGGTYYAFPTVTYTITFS